MMTLGIYEMLLLLLLGFFHTGIAQLIFASDDLPPSVTKCNEHQPFKLPANVTNLQKHDWTKMVVQWKYNDTTEIYFHNGEALGTPGNPRINGAFKAQALKEEDVEKGDVSLTLSEPPPAGIYSCEVIELSTEGKKTLTVYHESVTIITTGQVAAIVVPIVLTVISTLIHACLCCKVGHPWKIAGSVLVVLAEILIITGVILFIVGEDWSQLQHAGLGLAVFSLLLLVIFQFLLWYAVKVSKIVWAMLGAKLLFWILSVVGFFWCIQGCPPAVSAVSLLTAGLFLFWAILIGDLVWWFMQGKKNAGKKEITSRTNKEDGDGL